jgi:hypothetical protein
MPRPGRRKRLAKIEALCAYCGEVPASTVDHVVPKGLFSSPLPSDMITVPACSPCNSAKSRLDIFLRDYLVCNVDAPPNATADAIRIGRYQRAIDGKRSELWREIQSDRMEKFTLTDGNGNYQGMFVNMPFSKGPLSDSITLVTKGIYFQKLKRRIPENHTFLVGWIADREALLAQYQQLKDMGHTGIARIGDGSIFKCFCGTYRTEDEAVAATMWGLIFYNRTYITCYSVGPSLTRKMNPVLLARFRSST